MPSHCLQVLAVGIILEMRALWHLFMQIVECLGDAGWNELTQHVHFCMRKGFFWQHSPRACCCSADIICAPHDGSWMPLLLGRPTQTQAGLPLVQRQEGQDATATQRVHVYAPNWALQGDGFEPVVFQAPLLRWVVAANGCGSCACCNCCSGTLPPLLGVVH